MAFKETEFITKILRPYVKQQLRQGKFPTSYLEAKVSTGNTVPFSSFQHHQIPTFKKINEGFDVYKPSDSGIGGKPADLIAAYKLPCFIAILFQKEKTPRKVFYLISIQEVLALKQIEGKKSITRKDCEERGYTCLL